MLRMQAVTSLLQVVSKLLNTLMGSAIVCVSLLYPELSLGLAKWLAEIKTFLGKGEASYDVPPATLFLRNQIAPYCIDPTARTILSLFL